MGIRDWGLGIGFSQSPIPYPLSPVPSKIAYYPMHCYTIQEIEGALASSGGGDNGVSAFFVPRFSTSLGWAGYNRQDLL